ncbi:MAG: putative manganese transporter, partial [Candidatus Omnitrophota bacterium]
SLVGIIPESGPNIIFIMMFAKGMVPFSVLVANSIVQDGHGMIPMLSYSIKDSIYIKSFNLFIGITLGYILFLFGL